MAISDSKFILTLKEIMLSFKTFFKTPIMTIKIIFKLITFIWPERGLSTASRKKFSRNKNFNSKLFFKSEPPLDVKKKFFFQKFPFFITYNLTLGLNKNKKILYGRLTFRGMENRGWNLI